MRLLLFPKLFIDHKSEILRKISEALVNTAIKRHKRDLQVVFLTHFKCEQKCFENSQPKALNVATFFYSIQHH